MVFETERKKLSSKMGFGFYSIFLIKSQILLKHITMKNTQDGKDSLL